MKQNFKRWSLPLILVICYLTVIAILAFYADKQGNGGFIDFDYAANFVIFLYLTGPAFLMASAGLCWIIEFVRYKEYRYEKHSFAIASLICGLIFLIGIFSFFFLTLGIF